MLKKLFLPLFIILLFGITALITNAEYVYAYPTNPGNPPTDPCENISPDPAHSACVQDADYTRYQRELQEWREANQAWVQFCNNTNIPGDVRRAQGCNIGGGGGGGSRGGTTVEPSPSPNPTPNPTPNVDEEDEDEPDTPAPEQPHTDEYQDGYRVPNTNTTIDSTKNCDRGFLGMIAWYCNTDFENASAEEDITRVIVMIAVNIFTDITVIATYLVIGYIIYGGYQYIFANGDVGKVTTGKKALNQAFIGLAITLSAHIIVDAIRIALMHGSGDFEACATTTCIASADTLVTNLIQWVVGICGVVAAVFVVGGGIMYTTSAGDPNKLQTAKNVIKYALIGLIIVALAEIITGFMATTITNAKNTVESSYINNTKEFYENQKIS